MKARVQPGLREVRAGEGILVQLPGAAFVRAEQGRAQLGSLRARGQHGVQPGPVHDASGRDQRKADGGPHRGDQLRRRARLA